jgi:hypothetical protein
VEELDKLLVVLNFLMLSYEWTAWKEDPSLQRGETEGPTVPYALPLGHETPSKIVPKGT